MKMENNRTRIKNRLHELIDNCSDEDFGKLIQELTAEGWMNLDKKEVFNTTETFRKTVRRKEITIMWSEPVPLKKALKNEYLSERGVYFVWGSPKDKEYFSEGKEECLLIGKTKTDFKERMKAHSKQFFKMLEESTVIYFGIIQEEHDEDLYTDVYSALVFNVKPHYMGAGIERYRFMTECLVRISNEGNNNHLPCWVDALEQVQWRDSVTERYFIQ